MKLIINSPTSGVFVGKRYAYWNELLQQWVFLVERVYRITNGKHAVYSYKERTNVGLLAAAAAANGWVALEECSSEKYVRDGSEDLYRGRSDLRIWRDTRHHEVEAKLTRLALSNTESPRVDKAAERALLDTLRSVSLATAQKDRKVAVAFVVPTIPEDPKRNIEPEKITNLQKRLVERILEKEPAFMAYSFPGPAKAIGSRNRTALGIILFGNEPSEG